MDEKAGFNSSASILSSPLPVSKAVLVVSSRPTFSWSLFLTIAPSSTGQMAILSFSFEHNFATGSFFKGV